MDLPVVANSVTHGIRRLVGMSKMIVLSFILMIKSAFEASGGEAEETRSHNKVQPLQSRMLQKSERYKFVEGEGLYEHSCELQRQEK